MRERSADPDVGAPGLRGIPETALIPLFDRAAEAARPEPLLRDPLALDVAAQFSPSARRRYGRPGLRHVLRASQFDEEVQAFLNRHPTGTVISLGEGLETELWRIDNGVLSWISVDLPEMITLRRRVLPAHPRARLVGLSALDEEWTRCVEPGQPSLILAQGLLMYFTESQVQGFFTMVAKRCRGARVVFDTIPAWAATSGAGHRQVNGYRMPAQPWGTNRSTLGRLLAEAGIHDIRVVPAPRGRGLVWGTLYPYVDRHWPGMLPMTVTCTAS